MEHTPTSAGGIAPSGPPPPSDSGRPTKRPKIGSDSDDPIGSLIGAQDLHTPAHPATQVPLQSCRSDGPPWGNGRPPPFFSSVGRASPILTSTPLARPRVDDAAPIVPTVTGAVANNKPHPTVPTAGGGGGGGGVVFRYRDKEFHYDSHEHQAQVLQRAVLNQLARLEDHLSAAQARSNRDYFQCGLTYETEIFGPMEEWLQGETSSADT